MSFTDDADDWQVLCIESFGAGLILAAQFFVFDFFSEQADITARFRLSAFGIGFGGGSAGWVVPGLSDWSDIHCKRAFSAQRLHYCAATLAPATVGVGANVGPCLISAITQTCVSLFEDQDAGGLSGGISAGAYALAGTWKFTKVVSNRPSPTVGA